MTFQLVGSSPSREPLCRVRQVRGRRHCGRRRRFGWWPARGPLGWRRSSPIH